MALQALASLLISCASLLGGQDDGSKTPASDPPKFEASGIRGLIDPGGYSAPAAAASASGLISGMANVERKQNRLSAGKWPCYLEPTLKKAVAGSPSAETLQNLGQFYLEHARFKEAYPLLRIAAEEHPNSYSLDLLAQAYEGSGMFSHAARVYLASAKLAPSEDNLFGAGYESILSGSPAVAIDIFREGLARYPKSFILNLGSGTANFLAGRIDAASNDFLKAIELRPADPAGYRCAVMVLQASSGASSELDKTFRQYAEHSPQNSEALYDFALSLRRQNPDDPRVENLLKRSIAIDAKRAEAHLELGLWYSTNGNVREAIREFEDTVRLEPGSASTYYHLAQAYRSVGDTQKADDGLRSYNALKNRSKSESGPAADLQRFISVFNLSGEKPAVQESCVERKP